VAFVKEFLSSGVFFEGGDIVVCGIDPMKGSSLVSFRIPTDVSHW